MAVDLVSYLSSGDTPRLWVNFNDYTKKLLLGEGENPWTTPASYMAFYGQAHGLVKADVVVLDVWDLFQHWMEEDEKAIPAMAEKKRVPYALKTMLDAFAPRELLAEVITAVSNNYGGETPIVLVVPSPRSLLVRAHKAATGNDADPEEMVVDTAAMYLADFLRYFSETDISGVLLVEDESLMPASTEELSWYQPVVNVTKHYRWSIGVQLPFADDGFNVPDDVEILRLLQLVLQHQRVLWVLILANLFGVVVMLLEKITVFITCLFQKTASQSRYLRYFQPLKAKQSVVCA